MMDKDNDIKNIIWFTSLYNNIFDKSIGGKKNENNGVQ